MGSWPDSQLYINTGEIQNTLSSSVKDYRLTFLFDTVRRVKSKRDCRKIKIKQQREKLQKKK